MADLSLIRNLHFGTGLEVSSTKNEQMKTIGYIRKRMAHLAIGPAVGALVAGVLLTILMLNIA